MSTELAAETKGPAPVVGTAIGAVGVSIAAVAALPVPMLALALGCVGVLVGLLARRTLRAESTLRGSRLSLLAVLMAGVVILITAPGIVVGLAGAILRLLTLGSG